MYLVFKLQNRTMPFNVKLNQLDWRELWLENQLAFLESRIAWINSVTLSVRQWYYIQSCNLSLQNKKKNRKSFSLFSLSLSLSLSYSVLFISDFLYSVLFISDFLYSVLFISYFLFIQTVFNSSRKLSHIWWFPFEGWCWLLDWLQM